MVNGAASVTVIDPRQRPNGVAPAGGTQRFLDSGAKPKSVVANADRERKRLESVGAFRTKRANGARDDCRTFVFQKLCESARCLLRPIDFQSSRIVQFRCAFSANAVDAAEHIRLVEL